MKKVIAIVASVLVLASCSKDKETGIVYRIEPEVESPLLLPDYGIQVYVRYENGDSSVSTMSKFAFMLNDYRIGRTVSR